MLFVSSAEGVSVRIRVLVVDNENMTRDGIALLIGRMSGVEVVGGAANGRTALKLIRDLKPNIIIANFVMPEMNGLELLARAREEAPNVRTIILTPGTYDSNDRALLAFRAGASSFLLREMGEKELERAIRAASRGEVYIPTSISKRIIEALQQPRFEEPTERLTSRQREVLQVWVEGGTSAHIAATLNMSCKTVEFYKSQIRRRLGIQTLGGLVKYAVRNGITPP